MVKVRSRVKRVGQNHPKAKLTDHEVELMRRLRDEGMTYLQLAEKFEAHKATVQGICNYSRR